MIKGFRDFLLRGNVIDLAIAVVIGTAFTAVVTQITKSFIEPLIKLMGGGGVNGGTFTVHGVIFDWGAALNAVINFVIVAAVVYFIIVVPMNALAARRRKGEPEAQAAPVPEDVALLREIRDLLKR